MSHGLVGNSIQKLCVGYMGMCVRKKTLLLLDLHFCWLHTVLSHTSVIFMSLCYLWALFVTLTYARTSSLTRHTRKAVDYKCDIPAGNSFSKGGKGGLCASVWWGCSVSSNTTSNTSCSLSLTVERDIPFSWMALASNACRPRAPALSASNTLPATYSISHLFTASVPCQLTSLQSMFFFFNVALISW